MVTPKFSVILLLLIGSVIQGGNSAYLITPEKCYQIDDALLPKDYCPLDWVAFFKANSLTNRSMEEPKSVESTENGLTVYDPLQAADALEDKLDDMNEEIEVEPASSFVAEVKLSKLAKISKFLKMFCLKDVLAKVSAKVSIKKESIFLFALTALFTFSTLLMFTAPALVALMIYETLLARRRLVLKMNAAIRDEKADETSEIDQQVEETLKSDEGYDADGEYEVNPEVDLSDEVNVEVDTWYNIGEGLHDDEAWYNIGEELHDDEDDEFGQTYLEVQEALESLRRFIDEQIEADLAEQADDEVKEVKRMYEEAAEEIEQAATEVKKAKYEEAADEIEQMPEQIIDKAKEEELNLLSELRDARRANKVRKAKRQQRRRGTKTESHV